MPLLLTSKTIGRFVLNNLIGSISDRTYTENPNAMLGPPANIKKIDILAGTKRNICDIKVLQRLNPKSITVSRDVAIDFAELPLTRLDTLSILDCYVPHAQFINEGAIATFSGLTSLHISAIKSIYSLTMMTQLRTLTIGSTIDISGIALESLSLIHANNIVVTCTSLRHLRIDGVTALPNLHANMLDSFNCCYSVIPYDYSKNMAHVTNLRVIRSSIPEDFLYMQPIALCMEKVILTENGMCGLRQMTRIEELSFDKMQFPDMCCNYIDTLSLGNNKYTPAWLEKHAGSLTALTTLLINSNTITDNMIYQLTSLTYLDANPKEDENGVSGYTEFTDYGLKNMTLLESLRFTNNSHVTAIGLSHLDNLENLDMVGTDIDDLEMQNLIEERRGLLGITTPSPYS